MCEYYMFDCNQVDGEYPTLNHLPMLDGKSQTLFSGLPITTKVLTDLSVRVRDGFDYEMIEYYSSKMVMRDDLITGLRAARVDNIQTFDIKIINEPYDEVYGNYKAVNIIGKVSIADMNNATFNSDNQSRLIDASIDSFSIDANKCHGLLMFRLKESITDIAIHESVKKHLESIEALENLTFIKPDDFYSL